VEGTETAELLLDRDTENPPLLAALERLTMQPSLPAPVSEEMPQVSPLKVAAAVVGGSTNRRYVCVILPAEAVSVTDWAEPTLET
jgi:hypothetical protein